MKGEVSRLDDLMGWPLVKGPMVNAGSTCGRKESYFKTGSQRLRGQAQAFKATCSCENSLQRTPVTPMT